MPWNELIKKLSGIETLEHEPLSRHLTFRVGGPCRLMAMPNTVAQLQQCLHAAHEMGVEPFVLGRGSNLIAPDAGVARFVIKPKLEETSVKENCITAECGISLRNLAVQARDAGLSGLEFAHGIPGTLGGAVVMNAGAYGGEMKDVVRRSTALDMSGKEIYFTEAEHEFSYRHSVFAQKPCVIVRCELELHVDDADKIATRMQELEEKRRASQPLEYPSAGSTFKRPKDAFAAALIEQCGLKGARVGDAQVSEKHSGFIVNVGQASCDDILKLMELVQETVLRETGIALEPEVKFLQ